MKGIENNSNPPDGELPDDFEVPDDLSGIEELEPDPRPKREGRKKAAPAPMRATARTRKNVEDALFLAISVPAGIWEFRDEHCGGAAVEHARSMAKAWTPIALRNPAVVAWLTGPDARFMDWVAVWIAMKPFIGTVWSHHVTKTIGHEGDSDADSADDYSQYAAPRY